MSFKLRHRESERKTVTQDAISMSNGSQHSNASVIPGFLFTISGFVDVSRQKLFKLEKN